MLRVSLYDISMQMSTSTWFCVKRPQHRLQGWQTLKLDTPICQFLLQTSLERIGKVQSAESIHDLSMIHPSSIQIELFHIRSPIRFTDFLSSWWHGYFACAIHWRCQYAKSAYCIDKGGSCTASPTAFKREAKIKLAMGFNHCCFVLVHGQMSCPHLALLVLIVGRREFMPLRKFWSKLWTSMIFFILFLNVSTSNLKIASDRPSVTEWCILISKKCTQGSALTCVNCRLFREKNVFWRKSLKLPTFGRETRVGRDVFYAFGK